MCLCVRACVHACVRACVRACVCVIYIYLVSERNFRRKLRTPTFCQRSQRRQRGVRASQPGAAPGGSLARPMPFGLRAPLGDSSSRRKHECGGGVLSVHAAARQCMAVAARGRVQAKYQDRRKDGMNRKVRSPRSGLSRGAASACVGARVCVHMCLSRWYVCATAFVCQGACAYVRECACVRARLRLCVCHSHRLERGPPPLLQVLNALVGRGSISRGGSWAKKTVSTAELVPLSTAEYR
jgi:hypothetical protein